MTKSLVVVVVVVVLSWLGCARASASPPSAAPAAAAAGSRAAHLIPAAPGRFGFERIALRGAAVDDVGRAYGVVVAREGWTDLIGDRWPRRAAPAWTLGVEARDGRVTAAHVMIPILSHVDERAVLAAARARLGSPADDSACWWRCAWPAAGVSLTVNHTRTTSFVELTLE